MRIVAAGVTWLRRVIDLGLIALIVVVLLGVAVGKLAPLTGRQSIAIGGSSMEPAVPLGAAVVVSPVPASSLAVGDVVSLQVGAAHAVFTHRIVALVDREDGRWVRTKGDANRDPDPELVPASAIIGRVDAVIPALGYLLALLSLPIGVLFVIGLAATLVAIAWLLESLEPPRQVGAGIDAPPRPAERAPRAVGTLAARPVTGHDLVARSMAAVATARTLEPRGGVAALQLVAGATRAQLALMADPFAVAELEAEAMAQSERSRSKRRRDPSSLPRPNAREQIARTREVRVKRARWDFLHRGPDASRTRRRGTD